MTPRYYTILENKRAGLDRYDRFRHLATDLMDTNYVWGAENLQGVDCSGSVCLPLLLMRYNIRTTATDLYRRLFVHPVAGHHDKHVAAVFVLTNQDVQHNDRIERAGGATHVMPVVGDRVVVDASWGKPTSLRSFDRVEDMYLRGNTRIEVRALDWGRAQQLSDNLTAQFGVDPVVSEIMGVS